MQTRVENGGWIEAKRKNSKSGSKESSIKSSASTTSQNSGKQVEKMKRIIREEGQTKLILSLILSWQLSHYCNWVTIINDNNSNLQVETLVICFTGAFQTTRKKDKTTRTITVTPCTDVQNRRHVSLSPKVAAEERQEKKAKRAKSTT